MKTTTMKRPNYYILLDLPFDPPVEDENQIRAALNKKLSEWRRNTNHPRLQQQVKYYISLKQNMEEVMLNDPQARKNEAAAAKNQAQAEQMKEIKEREARPIRVLGGHEPPDHGLIPRTHDRRPGQ